MITPIKVFCFDVDDTLNIPGAPRPGPVEIRDLIQLRNEGHMLGICGNEYPLFKFWPDWYKIFSICNIMPTTMVSKALFLKTFKGMLQRTRPEMYSAFIMVGNRRGDPRVLPGSVDDVEARLANWLFISETDFSRGKR